MNPEVYFARNASGPIKIGYASDLNRRVGMLSALVPGGVSLLARVAGDRRTESYFHSLLARHRIQGEWFAPADAVLQTANDVAVHGLSFVPKEYWPSPSVAAKQKASLKEVADSALQFLHTLADPRPATETIGDCVHRIADRYGLPYRTVKAIWYGEAKDISASVYVTLKEAFDLHMAERFNLARQHGVDRAGTDPEK